MPKPIDLNDVDEVWLAMEHARNTMTDDGHRSSSDPTSCRYCYAMYLLKNGMEAYMNRIDIKEKINA